MIPVLSDFAGLSPSCCAVLVQIEHCANKSAGTIKNRITSTNINIQHPLVITIEFHHKSTSKIC